MTDVRQNGTELKNTGYEIFIGILSILSIVNIVMMYVADDPNLDTVINADERAAQPRSSWSTSRTDCSPPHRSPGTSSGSSVGPICSPACPFPQAKMLRVFRLVRVFRLLREYGIKTIARSLIRDRAGSALLTLLLMGILVLEFGSLGILYIEQYAPRRQHHLRIRCPLVRASSPSPPSATATASR